MLVRVYKAGKYRLRITVPKIVFDTFVKYNAVARGDDSVPYFQLRFKNDKGEPYFSNCDFGLDLDLRPYYDGMGAVRQFLKSNYGIVLNTRHALNTLGLVEGMQLDCQILDRPTFSTGYFNKIIGFKLVRPDGKESNLSSV